jgi:hypothetical protein
MLQSCHSRDVDVVNVPGAEVAVKDSRVMHSVYIHTIFMLSVLLTAMTSCDYTAHTNSRVFFAI